MVSIIIPVYNNSHLTAAILQDLMPVASKYQIVVVDDGSTDGTFMVVQHFLQTIKYIHHNKNMGVPFAWNSGIQCSDGDPVIFLNNDVRITNLGSLDILALATEGKYIVGPTIRSENPLTEFHGQYLRYVDGWCFAVPRRIFDDIGLFDNDFAPGSFEDAEFCQRAINAGYELRAAPEILSMMIHAKSQTFSKYHDMNAINTRNRGIFLAKMEKLWGVTSNALSR